LPKTLPNSILFLFPKNKAKNSRASSTLLQQQEQQKTKPSSSTNSHPGSQPATTTDTPQKKESGAPKKKKKEKKKEQTSRKPHRAPHCTAPFPLHRDALNQSKNLEEAKLKPKQSEDGDRDCRNLRDEMRSHPWEMKIRMKLR